MKNLFNLLLFQITWFLCVWSVGQGTPYYGVLVVAGALFLHFTWIVTDRLKEVLCILKIVMLGGIVETISSLVGLIAFKHTSDYFYMYPPYMWAMWANFAMTLHHSMRWLNGRYLLGTVLGGVAGPAAYYGAAGLGAIHLEWNTFIDWAGFAMIWGITMLIIVRFVMEAPSKSIDFKEAKNAETLSETIH